jgi:hypothetical protein
MTTPNGHDPAANAADEDCPTAVSLGGLARAVEAVERRVDGLAPVTKRVDELAAMLTRLAQQITAAKGTGGGPSMVASCWLDLAAEPSPADTRADAEDILAMLTGWVGEIFLRYSDARLPDCWLWHPDVVEELLWLHAAWIAAYDPDAPVGAAGDWHDRQRPGVVARIKTYAGLCSLEAHQPGQDRHHGAPAVPTTDAVSAIAAWWAGDRHQPAPTPTPEQIEAARAAIRRGPRR